MANVTPLQPKKPRHLLWLNIEKSRFDNVSSLDYPSGPVVANPSTSFADKSPNIIKYPDMLRRGGSHYLPFLIFFEVLYRE